VLIDTAATWIAPGGSFERVKVTVNRVERSWVVNYAFHASESLPQSWEIFSAIFDGFVDKADIIVFILFIGAAFRVIDTSGALDIGIISFLKSILYFVLS
jgi:uncharacterized ion transporter superfamily protein YfcC